MPTPSDSPSAFKPPHCPNPDCLFHLDSTGWRFKRAGFYHREARPHRIQRYRCSHCRRAFSSQTFSPTYWLRRPDLLEPVFRAEVAGSGHRQIAHKTSVIHATINASSTFRAATVCSSTRPFARRPGPISPKSPS
ncbi:MAG: hypothetical protein R3F21_01615 [Myxococcota bacterium]